MNRPVFVTGADGFIGSHLTERLVDAGADVHVRRMSGWYAENRETWVGRVDWK